MKSESILLRFIWNVKVEIPDQLARGRLKGTEPFGEIFSIQWVLSLPLLYIFNLFMFRFLFSKELNHILILLISGLLSIGALHECKDHYIVKPVFYFFIVFYPCVCVIWLTNIFTRWYKYFKWKFKNIHSGTT